MDLRVGMAKTLPDELQELIWRSYYSDMVIPWLIPEVETRMLNGAYEELFDEYCNSVLEITHSLCDYYQHRQLFFTMNMDFVEDRLFDVIATQEGKDMFEMYQVIKDNIAHPYLLRLGLVDMVDKVRDNGRDKLQSCIWCKMMLSRLNIMINSLGGI